METGPSLLLALLGVSTGDQKQLQDSAQGQGGPKAIAQGQVQLPVGADRHQILKYYGLQPEQRKEVQKKLYDTLYVITEYPDLPQNRDLSMAIGKTLAYVLLQNIIADPRPGRKPLPVPLWDKPNGDEFSKLRYLLRQGVTEAIESLTKANEEKATP